MAVEKVIAVQVRVNVLMTNDEGKSLGIRPVEFVIHEAEMPEELLRICSQKANIPYVS